METVKTLTTHYTVSNVGVDGGGNVTFGSAPASGETVVIIRNTANTQTLDLVENDPFLSGSFEDALDRTTHQIIEMQEELDRSFKVSRTNSITTSEFADDATSRASKTLGFDSDGNLTTIADFYQMEVTLHNLLIALPLQTAIPVQALYDLIIVL